jgi:hypothetical protein
MITHQAAEPQRAQQLERFGSERMLVDDSCATEVI